MITPEVISGSQLFANLAARPGAEHPHMDDLSLGNAVYNCGPGAAWIADRVSRHQPLAAQAVHPHKDAVRPITARRSA